MSLIGEHILLRIYLQGGDRTPFTSSTERILKAARSNGLAGATVLKGILGFGHHGLIKSSTWSLIDHSPQVLEIVDSAEKIYAFLEGPFSHLMFHGMATLERASVLAYRHRHDRSNGSLNVAPSLAPLSTLPKMNERDHMTINEDGILLRIFLGESDRREGKPLYEGIATKARELGLSGATVLRGTEGFGAHSVLHKSSLVEMSADLPIVIEVVDTTEKIQQLLPFLETMVPEGMVTMEYVRILMYRSQR